MPEITVFIAESGFHISDYVYSFEDYAVEHNKSYIYSICQVANGVHSARICAEPVKIEFDDIVLSDGDKVLTVRFNPNVSSLKFATTESKTDTIGSAYPFFFRNGTIKYREIPISGLISYHMDSTQSFMTKEELGINLQSGNLTHDNFAAERKFKYRVLEWLNNGQPKLFRSPAEGSCIVRLMNVSLSPNATVGRMLHTFSATGYEVADYNYENIKKYNLNKIANPKVRYNELKESVECVENKIEYEKVKNIEWWSTKTNSKLILFKDGFASSFYNTGGYIKTP